MGVLTDIVVADVSEADEVAGSIGPLQRWPGTDAKGIDHAKLGKLLSIVAGEPYTERLFGEFSQLAETSEDGPWVFQVPRRLVSYLSEMNDHEMSSVLAQWWMIEEFTHSGYAQALAGEVLNSLRELSNMAISEGKDLLMWMCL